MEFWKDVSGYEGLYQVSNYGRVKSLSRVVKRPGLTGPLQTVVEKILKVRYDGKGYVQVRLYRDGISTYPKVHRLVAQAFIPNPYNFPQVNHKDRIKSNNNSDNLEWVTSQRNTEDGVSKYFMFVDPLGDVHLIYNLHAFCKRMELTCANMYKVLKGERKHHKGWRVYEK